MDTWAVDQRGWWRDDGALGFTLIPVSSMGQALAQGEGMLDRVSRLSRGMQSSTLSAPLGCHPTVLDTQLPTSLGEGGHIWPM